MNVIIHGHETEVQARWRSHILDRIEKLERFQDRIVKMEFILTASHHHLKGSETCHVNVKVPRKTIDVRKTAETMMEAIDAACKVVERQIHALYKDVKTRNRHKKEARLAKRNGVLV
jgi:ribosomal subunit interface protein